MQLDAIGRAHYPGCVAAIDHAGACVHEHRGFQEGWPINPKELPMPPAPRIFDTGATRDTEAGKLDYEGFLSPLAIERFGQYMDEHRLQKDGSLRASDNWQAGMPLDVYIKSAFRHFMEWWMVHRGHHGVPIGEGETEARDKRLEDALCALLFNVQGYLHETLQAGRE